MARRDVLVLCYHGVAPGSLHGEVTPEALHAQLNLLAARGYRWATFTDAVLGSEPERVAAITFDDGIASAVEQACRSSRSSGRRERCSLRWRCSAGAGGSTPPVLTRLAERGWEIGSHTMTHPVLTNVDDGDARGRAPRVEARARAAHRPTVHGGRVSDGSVRRACGGRRPSGWLPRGRRSRGSDRDPNRPIRLAACRRAWATTASRSSGLKCSRAVRRARSGRGTTAHRRPGNGRGSRAPQATRDVGRRRSGRGRGRSGGGAASSCCSGSSSDGHPKALSAQLRRILRLARWAKRCAAIWISAVPPGRVTRWSSRTAHIPRRRRYRARGRTTRDRRTHRRARGSITSITRSASGWAGSRSTESHSGKRLRSAASRPPPGPTWSTSPPRSSGCRSR